MSVRASLVRACTRFSGSGSSAKCAIRSSAWSSAASPTSSALSSGASSSRATSTNANVTSAPKERHAELVDGAPLVVFAKLVMSVLPLAQSWSRPGNAIEAYRGTTA